MSLSLHEATIPQYLQFLGALAGLIDKAEAHCGAHQLAHEELTEARLAEDMLPFAYQVAATVTHSAGAIAAVKAGKFSPDRSAFPKDFGTMRARVADAIAQLEQQDAAELEAIADNPMVFEIPDLLRADFTVAKFLLSFSQPNFYFHATTAYGLLRKCGVNLGKRDFLGRWQTVG